MDNKKRAQIVLWVSLVIAILTTVSEFLSKM